MTLKLIENILKYIFTYICICYKIKTYIFFCVNSIDKQTDEIAFAATVGQIDTSEYYAVNEFEGPGTLL